MTRLTVAQLRAEKPRKDPKTGKAKETEFADGQGLYFLITAAGSRKFIHRFQWQGRTRVRTLGDWPRLGLQDARRLRDADRELVRKGKDPIEVAHGREASAEPTFAEWATLHQDHLGPAKHRDRWLAEMTRLVGPLAKKKIDRITPADVKAVVSPIWASQPTTAALRLGKIARVLRHRAANLRPGEPFANPADHRLMADLMGKRLDLTHTARAALEYVLVPDFVQRLRERPAMAARALEWTIATGVRANEAVGARWGEIDWKGRVWTVPAGRMKGTRRRGKQRPHVVPLSLAMVRVLRRAGKNRPCRADDLIFPSDTTGRTYAHGAMSKQARCVVREMVEAGVPARFGFRSPIQDDPMGDREVQVHGFRSALASWGSAISHRERGPFERDLMDVCLAHSLGDEVSQAYLRDRWLQRRRIVMREWSAFVSGRGAGAARASNVVELRRAA